MTNNRDTIIIIDDDMTNLTVARKSLSDTYDVFVAPSGEKLFMLLDKITPSLILLDIEMPVMDGYAVIERLKENERVKHIPVIFLTAKIDPDSEIKGLSLGAVDYITKPFSRELLIKRVDLHILFEKQKKELLKHNLTLEGEIDKKTKTVWELQNAILKTVAELVECRDNVTGGHIERTQHYLSLLVDFLFEHDVYTDELSTWDIDLFIMSSQLHDVGKISIKDDILMKPGKLTDEEFEQMKMHTLYGVDIIRKIEDSTTENEFLLYAEILAGSHHEKWNGKGYPYALKGEDIPLHGRLMAIMDVYDALTDERPYKKAFSHETSVEIIRKESGEHFDPLITEVFLKHEKEFDLMEAFKSATLKQDDRIRPTIQAVANIVGSRDGQTHGHYDRIKHFLEIFITKLMEHGGYSEEIALWDKDLVLLSAQLHDIGKITVSDQILKKNTVLTDDEFESVKEHTDFGVKIIQHVKENIENGNLLHHADAFAGSHHEKWDGTGYPKGLAGNEIPLQGRIMAIVDVYDALTTNRPHRQKKSHYEAVTIIKNGSGTQFDPTLIEVFLECESEFAKI